MEEHMDLKIKIQDLTYQIQNQSTYEFYDHNNQNIEQKLRHLASTRYTHLSNILK